MKTDLSEAQVTILVEVDGKICLVAMTHENLKAVELVVKHSIENVVKTKRSQAELNKFLGYGG